MTRYAFLLIAFVAIFSCGLMGQTPATSSAPAPAASPEVMKLLTDLQAGGTRYDTIEAKLVYRSDMRMTGDREDRTGTLAAKFRKDPNDVAKFYVRFDTLKQGEGAPHEEKVEYAFDGMWLTEVKHSIKTMTRYQIVAEGQKVDPFKLGKGPIQLPLGQDPNLMLEYFDVSTRPSVPTDPNGTQYIKLLTKPQHTGDINFLRLEMWIDPNMQLPIKTVSEDKNKEVKTVLYRDMKINEQVDPNIFNIPRKGGDWQYKVEPLEKTQPQNPAGPGEGLPHQ